MSGHINHDTAARLLDLTPNELTALVNRGVIPRVDRNAYSLGHVVHAYIAFLRAEQLRLDARPTQPEIAAHLDISDRRLRELLTQFGFDHKQISLSEIRTAYIRDLREKAAGRATEGDLDLATERARLASEQADKIAMQNAERRGELAPVALMEQALAGAATRATKILDTIKGEIRRRFPELNSADLVAVDVIVTKAMNDVASMTLSEVLDDGTKVDEDEADAAALIEEQPEAAPAP